MRNGPQTAEAIRQDVLVQLPFVILYYFNIAASHLSTTVVSRLKSLMLLMWAVLCSLHASSFLRLTGMVEEILLTRHDDWECHFLNQSSQKRLMVTVRLLRDVSVQMTEKERQTYAL